MLNKKNIDESINDMIRLKEYGVSILDIPLGHLFLLLDTKGKQYDWLMDVLKCSKKRERILQECKQCKPLGRHGKVCENQEK